MHESERDRTVRRVARDGDPDRALAALFAPRAGRAGLLALIAFNGELARIAEQVSEPDLGAIRLQWWREAVARAASGETTGHPVADALGATIGRHELSRDRLAAMIDARGFDIATRIMPDQRALETYLQDTAGALFALTSACLGARGSAVELAAAQAGLAYGLTGLMRSLPMHAALGRVDLPATALLRHEMSPDDVLTGKAGDGLADLLAECRTEAAAAFEEARSQVRALDAEARAAFLPLALVEPYLAALARDPLHKVTNINPLYRLWGLARWRA